MLPVSAFPDVVQELLPAVRKAGRAVMAVYNKSEVAVRRKQDASPVTEADEKSEAILTAALTTIDSSVPVVAEEHASVHGLPQKTAREYFLIDPLDGTKEFLGNLHSFTINVALVQKGVPVLGVVYAPAMHVLYYSWGPGQAYRRRRSGKTETIAVRKANPKRLVIVASRSHRNPATESFLKRYPSAQHVSVGSSLKFCLVAEGQADLYPRLGPTMEWDTAAGHAILLAAGGTVRRGDGTPFVYGAADYRNGHFLASGDNTLPFVAFS